MFEKRVTRYQFQDNGHRQTKPVRREVILRQFSSWDVADQKQLVSLIPTYNINFQTGGITLSLHDGLSKILSTKRKQKSNSMNFIDKKILNERATEILVKNGIQVNGKEATIILEFLYLVSKIIRKSREKKKLKP